ncbi:MAG: serine hydrolase [Flavobacteriales bacterium]|nr:serine hydrolase [Flavobacteriales bacterium]
MLLRFFILSLFIGFYPGLYAQGLDFGKLNSYVGKAVNEHKITGLTIGIVKSGETIYQHGYGYCTNGETKRVNTTTNYGIASLSKAFTAAAMGMLVDEGKVNWDDHVITHLPDWKLYDDEVTKKMTIADLLTHRCGLKTFDGDLLWYGSNYSRKEIITRIRQLPLSYEYRNGFGYQNIMYITAGEVIAKVSGQSWDKFIRDRIFKPLGMNKSNTSISEYKENDNVAMPHLKGVPQKLINYDNSGATAAINSNVVDMNKWMMFLLNDGTHDGVRLMKKETLDMLWSMQNPLPVSTFDSTNGTTYKGYGMGWFLMDYQNKKIVHHGGGLPGYITKVFLVPEDSIGVVILTNDMSPVCTALMYKILDMLYGDPDKTDWSKKFAEYSAKSDKMDEAKKFAQDTSRKVDTKPGAELEAFAGAYSDPYYGNANIILVGKGKKARLVLSLAPAKALFTTKSMEHWQDNSFVFEFNDAFLPRGFANFELEGGLVKGFTIDLENPDFHFSNLKFTKN